MIQIKIPAIGESINEVTLLKWTKNEGDYVERDEVIAELESEKATFELNAEQAGIISTNATVGDTLPIGAIIGMIDETGERREEKGEIGHGVQGAGNKEQGKAVITQYTDVQTIISPPHVEQPLPEPRSGAGATTTKASPVAAAIITDKQVDPKSITPSGVAGKIMKHDVLEALQQPGKKAFEGQQLFTRDVRTEPMSNLRKTISRRLVDAKNSTAMLTTFNEVDMTRIMDIRKEYKDKFKEAHGINLGFMSFFAKACAIALSEYPSVNASIDNSDVIYHNYADISIAVSTPRGLTVPVMRNVESLSMAEVEKKVAELAIKARDSKLTMEELQGGTFTITNGGVFGSLMSTPIINLPQSAILGMHKIQDRPIALNGQVVIRPMMYIALSYDHRIIDGRESVGFLVRVKELLENPEQLLLGKDAVKLLLEL